MTASRSTEIAYVLLRLVSGLLFMQVGSMKLFGWYGGMPGSHPGVGVRLVSEIGLGAVLEFYGGIAIMLGLFTRPVAFVLSGEMAVAYWQFHAPKGAWPILNHGELAVMFCFLFLYMAARGAGEWSVDGWWSRRRARTARAV